MKKIHFLLFFCFISTSIFAQNKTEAPPKPPIVQALKFTPLAPLLGHTSFAYERLIRRNQSIEARLGVIGLGSKKIDDNKGANLTLGYKFIISKERTGISAINGAYLEPEISLGHFRDYYDKATVINEIKTLERKFSPITYSTFALNFGIQGAFKNNFLINYFFGAGYAAVFPKNGNDITSSIFQGNAIPFNRYTGNFKSVTFKMGLYLGGVWEKERKK